MNPEQRERLLIETQETAARLNKLNAFMESPEFPKLERAEAWLKTLLYKQQRTMSKLVEILGTRLENAGKKFEHASK